MFRFLCLPALGMFACSLLQAHGPRADELVPFNATVAPGGLQPGNQGPNFRLTDHRGLSRELYYESTAKAVVLVFTTSNSPRALQTAAALRTLRTRFSPRDVVIWQIESDPAADRFRIAAEQTLFNNDTPVLLDEAQLVASEYGAKRALDTFVLEAAPGARIVYRGPLDDADPTSTAAPTQNYAADAVAALLAGRTPEKPLVNLPDSAPLLPLAPENPIHYAPDVAPIISRRCVECHSPGNVAPFTFLNHAEVLAKASSIRAALLTQRMSPWHADPQYGVFSNSIGLTPAETATLHAWVKAGAPRGSGTDPLARATPQSTEWPLGTPDLILTIPTQSLPASGTVPYQYPEVPVPITSERWLRAAVVKPGNPRVVHHALVFEGTLINVLLAGGGLGGFFAGYVPGMQQTFFPEGTGKRLRPGIPITFQMHYTTTGQPETDATQIGLYFAANPPARELLTRAATNIDIAIPPGAKEYERQASNTPSATRDILLYEVSPHMHYRGRRFKFEAFYRDGTSEVLLNVPHYNFEWQAQYRFAQPKRLPAGTTIRVSGAFDNSAENPANPNPNVTVRFGEQTNDEMFIGYFNYAEITEPAAGAPPTLPPRIHVRERATQRLEFEAARYATNAPTRYTIARPLPAGLQADDTTGRISGMLAGPGRHSIPITATNAFGSGFTVLDLVVDAPTNAPTIVTPPKSTRARPGETVTLRVTTQGGLQPVKYRWNFRGSLLRETDVPELTLTNFSPAQAGEYVCIAYNSAGSDTSLPAVVSIDSGGLVNLSARANVGTGANVVIPGITVRGTYPKTLLIRAAGPALTGFGVSGALANPTLNVFNAAGDKVLVNDNWNEVPDVAALRAATTNQGAFTLPDGSRDAAVLVTLAPGSYTVQVAGAGTGAAAQGVAIVEVYEADASPSTLVNLSCRARVGAGADILIAGFVISGTERKRVLIRGVGPTLANLGVAGALADPRLDVLRQGSDTPLASNDNWDASLAPVFSSIGAFALGAGSPDAALTVELPPGSYTAQVSGVGAGAAAQGVAIVEVYELP